MFVELILVMAEKDHRRHLIIHQNRLTSIIIAKGALVGRCFAVALFDMPLT